MHVYRLREKGQRLARAVVIERGPVAGELLYRERIARSGIVLATLVLDAGGTYALPPLDRAGLRRVTPVGIMIAGLEVMTRVPNIKSSADWWPQAWWCVLAGQDAIQPLPEPRNAGQPVPAWQLATGVLDQVWPGRKGGSDVCLVRPVFAVSNQ